MQIVDFLNTRYQVILKEKVTILRSYTEMVESNPYRVLASYSYCFEEKPLRSNRIADDPALTATASEVESGTESCYVKLPNPLNTISNMNIHNEFIQMLINAKTMADLNNAPAPIVWRGHTTVVPPNFVISRANVKRTLLTALLSINNVSREEQKVSEILFLKFNNIKLLYIVYRTGEWSPIRTCTP